MSLVPPTSLYMKTTRFMTAVLSGVAFLTATLSVCAAESETLKQIKADGKIRIGMDFTSEGLSVIQRGKYIGLDVEIANLLTEELSKEVGAEIKLEFVSTEWGQLTQKLRDGEFDVAMSAIIPSSLYAPSNVSYSEAYLETGPVICCKEVDGKPIDGITEEVSSLAGKRIVIVNDPAARRVLRQAGIYVEADEGNTNLESSFPKSATIDALAKIGSKAEPMAVAFVTQLDGTPDICEKISTGEADAGVIDMGIIWWMSLNSERWAPKLYSFTKPVGPYIYSVVARAEDSDLTEAINGAISKMKQSPRYTEILKNWHAGQNFSWNLHPKNFLD